MLLSLFEKVKKKQKGTYICAHVSPKSSKQILKYCTDNNIPSPNSKNFHCTLMYSPESGYFKADKTTPDPLLKGKVKGIEKFGERKNCIVFELDSKDLIDFHEFIKKSNSKLKHTFEDFRPHVTLTYDGEDVDIEKLPKFRHDILFDVIETSELED